MRSYQSPATSVVMLKVVLFLVAEVYQRLLPPCETPGLLLGFQQKMVELTPFCSGQGAPETAVYEVEIEVEWGIKVTAKVVDRQTFNDDKWGNEIVIEEATLVDDGHREQVEALVRTVKLWTGDKVSVTYEPSERERQKVTLHIPWKEIEASHRAAA